jgi:ribosomal protein S18 acetylase RimI-like enzyme
VVHQPMGGRRRLGNVELGQVRGPAAGGQVRDVTDADIGRLSVVLARAFFDDPIMAWVFPAERRRDRKLIAFFSLALRARLRRSDLVLTTPDVDAGVIWAPPGRWKAGVGDLVGQLPGLARVFGRRPIVPLLSLFTMERHHPPSLHWYVNNLGTSPACRERGLGSALLKAGLDRCDADGVGAYLETANERNLAFYARFGFVVTREVDMPARGPHVWMMWRDPRGTS